MFRKILIANRGEIACRVAATARRLGIATVAVHSDVDAQAVHVKACDEAICIGTASPRDSYLRADRMLEAAKATGAQAIHPGYGFLSENEDFAQACEDAGIAFIGPPASAIAAMGSKSAAKALMQQAGVPLVPGYHGGVQEAAFLRAQADAIGYPVLIKASAGGGGKGMRTVHRSEDFEAALASCQREASASFGDAKVLVERYVTQPRHIEIQVFGDKHGRYVYLFERDCSVQRRHQKVLEEAPAPGMTPERRKEMGEAAIAAARSVGYVGAGTVEFICEQSGQFYFMEMNTRLQVEHPVTEAITGLDLVEWQLRVAAGEPLPLQQADLQIHGHAIEARICAENPQQQFLPSTGTLRTMHVPPAAARFAVAPVRIDSGVRAGDTITPHYDSMIAKLIVHGKDREAALRQLSDALRELHITGLHTNVAFLRRVIHTDSFTHASLDTALIESEHAALFEAPGLPLGLILPAAAAKLIVDTSPAAPATAASATGFLDPWSAQDGWRLHGHASRREWLAIGDTRHVVRLTRRGMHAYQVQWEDGGQALLRIHAATSQTHGRLDIEIDGRRMHVAAYRHEDTIDLFMDEGSAQVQRLDPLRAANEPQAHGGRLTALMPGKVIALLVQPGQAVKQGDPLAVTEAMKMEHTLTAPRAGTVATILCAVGDQLAEGAELLRIDQGLVE